MATPIVYNDYLEQSGKFSATRTHYIDQLVSYLAAPVKISADTFTVDNKGYIKFNLMIEPTMTPLTSRYDKFQYVSCEIAEAGSTTYVNFNANQKNSVITDTKNEAIITTHQFHYVLRLQYQHWYGESIQPNCEVYQHVYITVPHLNLVKPFTNLYNAVVRLAGTGSADWNFTIENPYAAILRGKFTDEPTNKFSSNLTTVTVDYSFTREDVGKRTFRYEWDLYDLPLNLGVSGGWHGNWLYFYWYDENNKYHSVYNSNNNVYPKVTLIYENNFAEYEVDIQDNSSIFTLNSATIAPVSAANHAQRLQWFLRDTGAIQLNVSFSYTAAGNNTFKIKLYDISRQDGEVFVQHNVSYTSPGTHNLQLYSNALDKAQSVYLKLEITDVYGRKLEQSWTSPTIIYDYNRPKIKAFDGYFGNAAGGLDLQSTHCLVQASFVYSDLDGGITLSQSMTLNGVTFDPALVSGARKYIGNVTLPIGTDSFNIVYTITDSIGNSDTLTFKLSRKGGVILDFNNTGYGMAVGKTCETNAFEVNFPTMFFNKVTYVDGTRQTGDAATNLGFMDTYNTGCRTIQEILDYIIAKIK